MTPSDRYLVAEPIWQGETAVVIATGPSLTAEQVDRVRGRARVIVVSDAWRLAPWADVLYSCDAKWWHHHRDAQKFAGLKVGLTDCITFPAVRLMRHRQRDGFDPDPGYLATGANSGYQAVHLAAHFGASRIVLLGFDMRVVPLPKGVAAKVKTHFFGDHPPALQRDNPFATWIQRFRTLAAPLRDRGIDVINCTPGSALDAFPAGELDEVFP